MMRKMVVAASIACLALLVASTTVKAQEEVVVKGKVAACAADCACPCKVTTEDGAAYRVTADDVGKQMAKEADGKKVEAKGAVAEKDGDKWLTVKEFKIVE